MDLPPDLIFYIFTYTLDIRSFICLRRSICRLIYVCKRWFQLLQSERSRSFWIYVYQSLNWIQPLLTDKPSDFFDRLSLDHFLTKGQIKSNRSEIEDCGAKWNNQDYVLIYKDDHITVFKNSDPLDITKYKVEYLEEDILGEVIETKIGLVLSSYYCNMGEYYLELLTDQLKPICNINSNMVCIRYDGILFIDNYCYFIDDYNGGDVFQKQECKVMYCPLNNELIDANIYEIQEFKGQRRLSCIPELFDMFYVNSHLGVGYTEKRELIAFDPINDKRIWTQQFRDINVFGYLGYNFGLICGEAGNTIKEEVRAQVKELTGLDQHFSLDTERIIDLSDLRVDSWIASIPIGPKILFDVVTGHHITYPTEHMNQYRCQIVPNPKSPGYIWVEKDE